MKTKPIQNDKKKEIEGLDKLLKDIAKDKGQKEKEKDKPKPHLDAQDKIKTKAETSSKCPDCDAELKVPVETEQGHILSCSGCGLELEVKKIEVDDKGKEHVDLQELTLEGPDWGE